MLEQNLKNQVKGLFESLKSSYTFQVSTPAAHPSKKELVELLEDVASCSEKVTVKIEESTKFQFGIAKDGELSNITFRAVPNGHEFTTLLLAVLNMEGIGKNLPDDTIAARIKALKGDINIQSFISLTCTNCPDVVQALNVFSMLNPNIKHELIDGAINKEEAERNNIQAVPSVLANGKPLHVGRASMGELLQKLEDQFGSNFDASTAEVKEYDVVIVGGGPAGVSSAIYSARKGFSVAIVAEEIGGQVTETAGIENLISVPKTTGALLTANLKEHLADYAIDIMANRRVNTVTLEEGLKVVTTSLGEILKTPALIIATGASWRKLGVPGESQYIGSGVAFCTHCDGPFYKGKKVAVVGGGNSGLEAAIDLSSIATDVTVLEYGAELNGDKVLQDKLASLANVKVVTSAATQSIAGNGEKVTGLAFQNREDQSTENLTVDGVFVQIGLSSNSQPFTDLVDTNRMGEIEIDANCRTKTPGIYAAGDVSVVPYKQIVIAMGEGAKAALSAFEDSIKGRLLA